MSRVKAKKILSKRCMMYLVHMVQKSTEIVSSIKDNPIVQEFLDIFLNNLSGLAPKTKVEFSIELALKTIPI